MYTCIYVYTYLYTLTFVWTYMYMYMGMFIYANMNTYIYIYICICTHIYTILYICTSIFTVRIADATVWRKSTISKVLGAACYLRLFWLAHCCSSCGPDAHSGQALRKKIQVFQMFRSTSMSVRIKTAYYFGIIVLIWCKTCRKSSITP